ncbi:unnamed protein product [Spirodela intermedia]|uniref:Uncharacterized protein n=1 Tax=Spirodela intermedia TaxID=51605 RepID=A0A7I8K8G3_SPIIN|nr:unnamed protein product [Spirodela intermedia]
MGSIGAPGLSPPSTHHSDHSTNVLRSKSPRFLAAPPRRSFRPSKRAAALDRRSNNSPLCRCRLGGGAGSDETPPSDGRKWDSMLKDVVRTAVRRWDEVVKSVVNPLVKGSSGGAVEAAAREGLLQKGEVEEAASGAEWDWERWKRHFQEMEEQANVVSILKSNLSEAVGKEDYEDAAKLKIAIAAATANDTVGRAISLLEKALEEERYQDATFIRDHAGTGLVGWWTGTSDDSADPFGRIIRITAEHGKYVARSFSSRQLANARSGFPLFEIYITMGDDGEYKQQAVYLKRKGALPNEFPRMITRPPGIGLNTPDGPTEEQSDFSVESAEIIEENEDRDDDSDMAEGLPGIQNILDDMIPSVKVKVLKVVSPSKVDRDLISKVIEQIIEDEDDEADSELEDVESDDELKTESDIEEIDIDDGDITNDDTPEDGEMSLKFVIGGTMQRMPGSMPPNELIRVPAQLEKKGRLSFLFSVKSDDGQREPPSRKGHPLPEKSSSHASRRSPDLIIADLAKALVNREKISLKMLKDVGELISLTVNQDRNHHMVNGRILFHRIEIPSTSDPLSGLYVSAQGMLHTEVLQLRRKFGQWEDDGVVTTKSAGLRFYEYVEALKLTGDPSVPAGQVAFRAKIGKQYQLPHKGIIPEEFGMIARYKGQGRLADPGFKNPRWVDGELVILDGKYIRGGPVIGFVYWAPEYHYLVFFNRLRLQS